MDYSPPGSSVHGILQVIILEWVACPPPGDLANPDTEPVATSPALAGRFFTTSTTWKATTWEGFIQLFEAQFSLPNFLFPSESHLRDFSLSSSNQGVEKTFLNKRNYNAFQNGIPKCDLKGITQDINILPIITETENARSEKEFRNHFIENAYFVHR